MKRDIIVIGSSAGGVEAIPRLLGSLSARIPAAFFVTLHISPTSESLMPTLIARQGHLPAEHPRDGTPIRQGHIYVAPPDHHLVLTSDGIRLSHGPKENRHRPAIDVMFRSAARVFGNRVAGVLLTGNLDDGVSGLQEIQRHQGVTVVQDPDEAPFPEMPRNALNALRPDHCLRLADMERLLAHLPCSTTGGRNMKVKRSSRLVTERPIATQPKKGPPMPLVCPECHGPLWELKDGKLASYECLVGHRYSLESLLQAHAEDLESALWIALRAVEERVNLQKRLAEQSRASGNPRSRETFEARAAENMKHAKVLRGIIEKIGRH
ncbi:MAG TPA: chemotaxis protein CheB [Verrucomicrobiae bacterium]|nr:chemotaxis protein CheB [Verrucomicrobiae bacterium]